MRERIILVILIFVVSLSLYIYGNAHIDRGIDWLLSHQSDNCAWTGNNTNPHLALRCLALASQVDQTFRRAYLRLRHLQALNGSWNNTLDPTSFAIWALIEAGDTPDSSSMERAVTWLKQRQRAEGYWGIDFTVRRTSIACIALISVCGPADPAVAKGIQWLKNCQNSDGGWGINPGGQSTAGGHYYYPVLALIMAEGNATPEVIKALNWWRNYNPTNPVWHIGRLMPFVYAGYLSDVETLVPPVLNCQNPDGGWPEAYGWPSRPTTTARAVISLLKAKELGVSGLDDTTSFGLCWINQHITDEGEFIGAYESVYSTGWVISTLALLYPYTFSPIDCAIQLYISVGGGWDWSFHHTPENYGTNTTGITAFALTNSGHPDVTLLISGAAQRLLDNQNADGGWPARKVYYQTPSDFISTNHALLGLSAAGYGMGDDPFNRGVSWVVDQLSTGSLGSNFYDGLLSYVLDESEATTPQLELIRQHLLVSQQDSGGWVEEPVDVFSDTGATAMAIVGLGADEVYRQAVIKGRRWLQAMQHPDGGWSHLPGDSPNNSLTDVTSYALWALIKTADLDVTPTLHVQFNRDDYLPGDSVEVAVTSPAPIGWLAGQGIFPDGSQQLLSFARVNDHEFRTTMQVDGASPPGAMLVSVQGETTQGFDARVGATGVEPDYQTDFWKYTFYYDNERWVNGGVPSLFDLPEFFWESERLCLRSNNNQTFGFWLTPAQGLLKVLSGNLYRLRFQVSSSLSEPRRVPEFRLRLNEHNFQRSGCYYVISSGSGENSPTSVARTYEMYVVPIQGGNPGPAASQLLVAFDLINLTAADEPVSTIYFEDLEVERMPLGYIDQEFVPVSSYDFTLGAQGWQSAHADPHTPAIAQATAQGLKLTSQNNTNTFGFWHSPLLAVEAGRLYRLRWLVSTDVANRALTPSIRLRVNSFNFQSAATCIVQSIGGGESSPQAGEYKTYDLYFLPDDNATAAGMVASFDLINIGLNDAANGAIILKSMTLEKARHPLF